MTIDDHELDRRLNALPRATVADESLWPRIEQRLHPTRRRSVSAVAAAVAAVGVGVLVLALSVYESTAPEPPAMAQSEAAAMRAVAPDEAAVWRVNASSPLVEAWHENQAAIEQLEQALERDPGNRLLLEFLSEARLRQARLIQRGLAPTEERSIEL